MKTKNGKFAYKNDACMAKMHEFYDKSVDSLQVEYKEKYISTTYGDTHILIMGDENKLSMLALFGKS